MLTTVLYLRELIIYQLVLDTIYIALDLVNPDGGTEVYDIFMCSVLVYICNSASECLRSRLLRFTVVQ